MGQQLRYDDHLRRRLYRLARECQRDALDLRSRGRKVEAQALEDLAEFMIFAAGHTDQLVWQQAFEV